LIGPKWLTALDIEPAVCLAGPNFTPSEAG